MHTLATDGENTIEEMAEAAKTVGRDRCHQRQFRWQFPDSQKGEVRYLRRPKNGYCRRVFGAGRISNLDLMKYGITQAKRAGVVPENVLNSLPLVDLKRRLGIGMNQMGRRSK